MVGSYRSAILLLLCFLEIGVQRHVLGQNADKVLADKVLARRQDGVFFGLGGLDASLMPFDLDAFFEDAAPTRTTSSSSATATPSKKPSSAATDNRQFSSDSVFTINRPQSSSTRLVDFGPSGQSSGRSPLVISRSGSQRQPPTARNVHVANLQRASESDAEDDNRGGRFRSSAGENDEDDRRKPSPSRFTFQGDDAEKLRPPAQRQSFSEFVDRPEQQIIVEDDRRRPIKSFGLSGTHHDDIRPIQHVPFRPSLTSGESPPIRFGGPSSLSPSRRPTPAANRFVPDPFPEVPRPNAILNFPSEPPRREQQPPPQQETTTPSFQQHSLEEPEEEEVEPEGQHRPAPTSGFLPPREPPVHQEPSEENQPTDQRDSRPIQQFDFSLENDDDRRPARPQSSSNLFDGFPSQDPPAQEVDENVDEDPRDFQRPSSFSDDVNNNNGRGSEGFFEPSPENIDDDRRPSSNAPSSQDEAPQSGDDPQPQDDEDNDNDEDIVRSSEADSTHNSRQPVTDDNDRFLPRFRPQSSQPSFRPQTSFPVRSPSRSTSSEDPVPSRFHGKQIDGALNRQPSEEQEDAETDFQIPPSPPHRRQQPSDIFSRHRPRGRPSNSVANQNIGTPRQFSPIVDDVTAEVQQQQQREEEPTGQLSASFARATEPTVFETESDGTRPSSIGHDPQRPIKVLRRKLIGRRRKLFHPAAVLQRDTPPPSTQNSSPPASQQQTSNHGASGRRDFDFERFPQRSASQGSSSNVVQTSNDVQTSTAPRKRLPPTDAVIRSTSGARAARIGLHSSSRGRSPSLLHRMTTTPTQFVTENIIEDFAPPSRAQQEHKAAEPAFQDTSLSTVIIPGQPATSCNPTACHLPKCFCGGNQLRPGNLRPEDTPQMIVLTFDDAVNDLNWALYTRLFFKDRRNPNGCPILSTFYVSHEWTDYSKVQNLYAQGHEMASHSISHGDGRDYSKAKWYNEIYGQKEIMNVYANVRPEDVKGMRSPFLAMGGDKQFSMLYDTNFTYDSSMTVTDVHPPYWPYTLDYALPHRCAIPPCPKLTYPGFWEIPMVALTDLNGGKCSMADGCSHATTEEGIYEMLMKNFERHYKSNRAPFGLYYHASWFLIPHRQEGFVKFLEDIMKRDDVYLVTALQMLEWVKNPTPLAKIKDFEPWSCAKSNRPPPCNRPRNCELRFKGDVRYMSTCHTCPEVYPWVGNTGVTKSAFTVSP